MIANRRTTTELRDAVKAIRITKPGGPEVLQPADDLAVPEPGADELLIKVAASGVNRPDVLQRKGLYPVPPGASELPGLEVAGTVERGDAAALRAAGFAVGDRVCALVQGGGYAEYCVAPVGQCLPTPANLTDVEAASLPETFFTVWANVFGRAGLQPGETLVVHGGSSGIGVAAIQLAKAHGATVIVTVGSADKAKACLDLGADHAVDYKTSDFVVEVQRITGKRGADVILDMVAGDYIARDVQCLAEDGRIAIIATLRGNNATFDAGLVLRRRLTISGSTLRPRPVAFKTEVAGALRRTVWPWLEAGRVKPVVHQVFPAAEASAAHALMETSAHIGKLVLQW